MKYKVGDKVVMKEYRGMGAVWFEEDSIQTIVNIYGDARYEFKDTIFVAEDEHIKYRLGFSDYLKRL